MRHLLTNLLPKQGSILVFSLIVLSFMLVSALSIAAVSVTERRNSSATEKSARSFQVADSGVEKLLQKIYKGATYADMSALAAAVGGSTACSGGVISGDTASGSFKVSLYDGTDAQIACDDTDWRDKAVKLRSEGVAGNTTRAVEVAVAAAIPSGSVTGGCTFGNGTRWGTATNCALNSGQVNCQAGNTGRTIGYFDPGGYGQWNSAGTYPAGFCIKD
jgi:Tfp pilus assembly protein PilX